MEFLLLSLGVLVVLLIQQVQIDRLRNKHNKLVNLIIDRELNSIIKTMKDKETTT